MQRKLLSVYPIRIRQSKHKPHNLRQQMTISVPDIYVRDDTSNVGAIFMNATVNGEGAKRSKPHCRQA
jgi:hypothetical protein